MYFHDSMPAGNIAPMDTKAIKQYKMTTAVSDMNIARGMFLLGFFTSSPV
jgi:hypothetical protein